MIPEKSSLILIQHGKMSLQERRWTTVTGGAPATIVDYVPSKTHGRRLPVFQNSQKLDANVPHDTDSLLVTWTVDLRPLIISYYLTEAILQIL